MWCSKAKLQLNTLFLKFTLDFTQERKKFGELESFPIEMRKIEVNIFTQDRFYSIVVLSAVKCAQNFLLVAKKEEESLFLVKKCNF